MSAQHTEDLYAQARKHRKSKPALTYIGAVIVLVLFLVSILAIGYSAAAPGSGVHWVLGGIVLFSFAIFAAVEIIPWIERHTGRDR